jgi:hypothetical protein
MNVLDSIPVQVDVFAPEQPFGGVVIEMPQEVVVIGLGPPPGPTGPQGLPGTPGLDGPTGTTAFARQGVTPLVNGQSFVSVVFLGAMNDATWVFGGCQVFNTVDGSALNIVPATITAKSASGFTIQLSGAPDSGNYFLQWAVSGVPASGNATTYGLSGPSSGQSGVASTSFMVSLPVGSTVPAAVTVTPSDGGAGGTFFPLHIMLTSASPSGAFTYTPASGGAKTISTLNDGALVDPPALTYTAVAPFYTLTGPTTGEVSVASTNFTVALGAGVTVSGTVTITPHDAGAGAGGTFTPTTVGLTNAAPSATFTYTPASTGTKTISTTNSSTLTDPASLSYNSTPPPSHLLNTLISYWKLDEVGPGSRADSQGTNLLSDSLNNTGSLTGKIGNAASFVAVQSTVLNHANNASLQVTSDFTFSLWVFLNSQTSEWIISKEDGVSLDDYRIVYSGGFLFGNDITSANVGSAASLSTWYHLVCWYDSSDSKFRMRINDTTTYVSSVTTALTQTATIFNIGARGGGTSYFDGRIDEVGFWKRKLTSGEITALYNGGAGLPFSSFTT